MCDFNSVCFLPRENQYVKSSHKRLFFHLIKKRCACFPPMWPQVMWISLTSGAYTRKGTWQGKTTAWKGITKDLRCRNGQGMTAWRKVSVQDPEVSCTPANLGTVSCHRDPRAKSFSLNESTDATSRLMKSRRQQKRITTTMRFERWVHLPLPPQICVLTVHLLEQCSVFSTSLKIHNDFLAPSSVLPSVQSWRYRW